jgi:ring-1,2-phenylacetyl-CoA epoxidase subunit PaaE
LTVARVDRLCADAAAITFEVAPELAEVFRFRPGQSLTVRRQVHGREERRSYSICAAAGDPLRVGVREVPGGALSGWLVHQVRPGDVVQAQAPSGSFTPDLDLPGRHVLIAAGSGITPVLSIASSLLVRSDHDVTVLYGNRRAETVMFADEVADLKNIAPERVQVVHVLSREAQEVQLFNGRLDAAKLQVLLPLLCDVRAVDHWWLCGPFGLVSAAMDVLAWLGVPSGRVHRELFYVEELPPAEQQHPELNLAGTELTVIMDGRATTTTVAPGVVVLDAAQRVRPELPFACRGGVCGTCRARVTDGEVTMRRNFALEQNELDQGFVLTCQSLPCTPSVTVDYDA